MSSFFQRVPSLWALGTALALGGYAAAHAQVSSAPLGWQEANEAVGQFPRGHADVLRWEQKNSPQAPDPGGDPQAGQLTLERATRLALQDQAQWIKPGMSALEIADNRQQAAALRWHIQKLWVDAVATRQSVVHSREIVEAAQAGAELAQRMADVGNWSRARKVQEELTLWDARSRLDSAALQAERALNALWWRIGARMSLQALAQQLPVHLPIDLPKHGPADLPVGGLGAPDALKLDDVATLQTQALQAHLRWSLDEVKARRLAAGLGLSDADFEAAHQALSVQAGLDAPVFDPRSMRWGHAFEVALQARLQADRLARQVRADVQMAVAAYSLARQSAQTSQAEVLRLHTELSQETLLRYTGMLKSTWDLLASARTRIQSVDAALHAQRQAWLAHADLAAVLSGLPYLSSNTLAGASSNTNPGNPTNPAGH